MFIDAARRIFTASIALFGGRLDADQFELLEPKLDFV